MAKQSLLQQLGFKRSRGRPESPLKISMKIPYGLDRKRKSKPVTLTKRQKKVALLNVEGAGVGFVIGTSLGGLGGMIIGVPAGTLAGNILARKRAGKKRGRPLKYKQKGFLNRLTSTRQERVAYNRKMLSKERKRK